MKSATGIGKTLLVSMAIVVLSMATGLFFNVMNPNGVGVFGGSTFGNTVAMDSADHEKAEGPAGEGTSIGFITLEEAKAFFDNGQTLFIDARSKRIYTKQHIRGAVSLPASSFDKRYEDFSKEVDKEITLVVYCQSFSCSKSEVVAEKLAVIGYTNIRVFAGGLVPWVEAGYPVEGE